MAATNRLFQDFIEFATDADPGSTGTTLSAPGLVDLVAVADPDFIALTLDPDAENGDPEIVWVTAHTASATTATISRGEEGTAARAHPVGTKAVAALTATAFGSIASALEVDGSSENDLVSVSTGSGFVTVATLPLSIPADWNSWKCHAIVTMAAKVAAQTGDGWVSPRITIDGDVGTPVEQIKTTGNEFVGVPAQHRVTGLTTTGSRTITAEVDSAFEDATIRDVFLYAQARRTS